MAAHVTGVAISGTNPAAALAELLAARSGAGPWAVTGPARQPRARWHALALISRARRSLAAARAEDVFLYSAALAFYGLISVAPLVVVALWVTSLLVGQAQIDHLADELAQLAPPALGVDQAVERVADLGTTLGLVAVVAALWPATAYGAALVRVLDRVARDPAATGLRGRGAALLLVGLVPVFVLGSLVASYVGSAAFGDTGAEAAVGLGLALVFGFTTTVATVAVIYKVFPRTPPDWRATLGGAVVAAGSISVLSAAYVAYLRLGANFERRYASDALAAVVLLGLWLFAANTALLVGYRVARGRGQARRDADGQASVSRRIRIATREAPGTRRPRFRRTPTR
jgi:YihY family inner membrane protein